jgi:hypothetical protein
MYRKSGDISWFYWFLGNLGYFIYLFLQKVIEFVTPQKNSQNSQECKILH